MNSPWWDNLSQRGLLQSKSKSNLSTDSRAIPNEAGLSNIPKTTLHYEVDDDVNAMFFSSGNAVFWTLAMFDGHNSANRKRGRSRKYCNFLEVLLANFFFSINRMSLLCAPSFPPLRLISMLRNFWNPTSPSAPKLEEISGVVCPVV